MHISCASVSVYLIALMHVYTLVTLMLNAGALELLDPNVVPIWTISVSSDHNHKPNNSVYDCC